MDQKVLGDLLPRFFTQLVSGCQLLRCSNPYCRSNPDFAFGDIDPDLLAVQLFVHYHRGDKKLLCHEISPLALNSQLTPLILAHRELVRAFINPSLKIPDIFQWFTDPKTQAFCYFLLSADGCFSDSDLQMNSDEFSQFRSAVIQKKQIMAGQKSLKQGFEGIVRYFAQASETLPSLRGSLALFLFADVWGDSQIGVFIPLLQRFMGFSKRGLAVLFNAFVRVPFLIPLVLSATQKALSAILKTDAMADEPHGPTSHRLSALIELLSHANSRTLTPISQLDFINHDLTPYIKADSEYQLVNSDIFSYTDTPAVLDPTVKLRLLNTEAERSDLFEVRVDRDRILDGFIERLEEVRWRGRDGISGRLGVVFRGSEMARDMGGPSREFVMLLATSLFESRFRKVNDSQFYWFHPNDLRVSPQEAMELEVSGLIVRLALGNGITLPVPLPFVLFKQLKGESLTLRDLGEIDPELAHNLTDWKRAYEKGDDHELTFTVGDDEICEHGGQRKVTKENYDEFVKAVLHFSLVGSVSNRRESFATGFKRVRETPLLKRLSAHDYWLMLMGTEVTDWEDLRAVTKYSGYTQESVPVQLFWKLFGEMGEPEKRKMLHFMTGSSRAPIGGLKTMNLTIERGADPERLPIAHTCRNILVLPDNQNEDRIRACLTICLQNHEGFGLI